MSPTRTARLLTILLPVLAALAVLGALVSYPDWTLSDDSILQLREGRFNARPGDQPPAPDAAGWQRMQLPHDWRRLPQPIGSGWYELPLPPGPPGEIRAVYLAAQLNAAVYLNQTRIGDGRLQPPVSRNFNAPQLVPIPPQALRPEGNRLLIHVATEPAGVGGLAEVRVGPAERLLLPQIWQRRLQVVAPKVVVIVTFAMALPLLGLWIRRRDKAFGWFAVTALGWSLVNLDFCLPDPPGGAHAWNWFLFSCVAWVCCAYPAFVHRFVQLRNDRLERALRVYALAGPLLLAAMPDHETMFRLATVLFNPLHGAIGLYCCLCLYRAWSRHGDHNARIMCMVSVFALVTATHDALVIGPFPLGHYTRFVFVGAPLMIGAFVWGLLGRFLQALDHAESLNCEMEARVQEKTRQLQASYDQLRQLEVERMLLAERTRIMRDMHDGVGGQLVATLCAVELGTSDLEQVKDDLRAALNDLRLVIDSLDPDEVSLHEVLYSFRGRMEMTLERTGLWVDWDIAEIPADFIIGPHKTLQIIRVLQEAVANVLKHAGAAHMRIACQLETAADGSRSLLVEVVDDGRGYRPDVRRGRGLPNMRRRAESIGARFRAESGAQGTLVQLVLPEHSIVATVPDPLTVGPA